MIISCGNEENMTNVDVSLKKFMKHSVKIEEI